MYVSNIKIQNYRNFINFEIDLKPFTLIIGENNSGKTNLLNALCLIFSQDITFYKKRVLECEDINCQVVCKFKEEILNDSIDADKVIFPGVVVDVEMRDFSDDQEAVVGDWFIDKELSKAQLTYVFRIKGSFDKSKWIMQCREDLKKKEKWDKESEEDFQRRKIDSINFPIKNYEYLIFGGHDHSKRVDFYFLGMLRMELLDALRDPRRELIASRDYRLLYKVLNNRDERCFSEIQDVLIKLRSLIKVSSELKKIKKDIKDYLDKISLHEKELDNQVEFQFSSPECCEILKKISLIYGNNPVNVERNGLGRNNLLYLSLVLSHLTADNSPIDNIFFRLVGIEEPEAHLHPQLQDHLAKNIKDETGNSKDMQIILTSHSTNIAAKLDLDDTVILYKDESNNINKHYILQGFGDSAEEKKIVRYLKKYLNATNSAMFFARKIIFVEGISEELLVPILFKMNTKKTLEQIGCNIVDVKGVAFKNFLEIVEKGYFIRCLVLTDSDPGTKYENRVEKLKDDYAQVSSIDIQATSLSTFEKDIIETNKKDMSKEILFKALVQTRPQKGKEFVEKYKNSDFSIDEFFRLIETYKSEFAFNLAEELKGNNVVFNLPTYIKNGFNFLMKETENVQAEK